MGTERGQAINFILLMKRLRETALFSILLIASMAMLLSCSENKKTVDATIAPRKAMEEALNAFYSNDFDTYVSLIDYGADLDSVERQVVLNVMSQYHERQAAKKGGVTKFEVLSADMPCDSLATVYFDLVFGNDSVEMCSEHLILRDGQWKIKVRGID